MLLHCTNSDSCIWNNHQLTRHICSKLCGHDILNQVRNVDEAPAWLAVHRVPDLHLQRKDLAARIKADVIFHLHSRAAIVHAKVLVAVQREPHLQHSKHGPEQIDAHNRQGCDVLVIVVRIMRRP